MVNNKNHNISLNIPKILIESSKKGSNPGGFCEYLDKDQNLKGYFKYCIGSRIHGNSLLKPENQPVYEAITLELIKKLGLKTPNFFVISNLKRDLIFEDPNKLSQPDNSGRPYYFFTELIKEPSDIINANEIGNKIIEEGKVYLESLNISDIIGKRQNYLILHNNGGVEVIYLDVGCSFVYATDGSIRLPNHLEKYLREGSKKKDKCSLKGKSIIGADKSLINLEELVYHFRNLTLPILNPLSRKPLSDLISEGEIKEIDTYLMHGLCESLKGYKSRGLLI